MKLLIVDDHAGMRALIRDLLRHVATHIRECGSGEEAVGLCESFAPDCVTMDLRLGAMHGLAAVQHIRQAHPDINIAILTQFDHDTLRARAKRAGADSYFIKEDMASLKRYVESLAEGSKP
jgi:DNA-binding NarL/FixJ family response regulator